MWYGMCNDPFQGVSVSLREMLDAREQRVARQKQMLSQTKGTLLCATMNIPGPVKQSPIIEQIFLTIVQQIKQQFSEIASQECLFSNLKTGPEYYFHCSLDPILLKQKMVAIEETQPLGRLVDLDVHWLANNGSIATLSRNDLGLPSRSCLICQKDAKECGRARVHSIQEMQAKIIQIIQNGKECNDEKTNSLYGNRSS